MKISAIHPKINSSCMAKKNLLQSCQNKFLKQNYTYNADTYYSSEIKSCSIVDNGITQISFCGYPVYIVDGGNHSTNMLHFAKAISKDMEPIITEVKTLPAFPNMKYLKDLESVLRNLRLQLDSSSLKYVAVPASASVALLNLKDQVNRIMNTNIQLTPENIKANKPLLLEFLKKIYENPEKYRQYIGYMDNEQQGIEFTYGVIQEINKIIEQRKAEVYVPAGHPFDETMKWMAGERNLKPELYNFIATGKDHNGKISAMQHEIKAKNWYNFNLLILSEANNITIKNTGGSKDYIFAGYDTCTTDGARGVYNFSPVRDENNRILGYSYTDTWTNEYPYKEFPANDEVANLAKFVGLDADNVIAKELEIAQFKNGIKNNNLLDKLYPIERIFSKEEIQARKLRLKGDFADFSKKLFFRKNNANKIIFPLVDCEGSGKPSVLPMWGCCFAVFNAIKNDIRYKKLANNLYQPDRSVITESERIKSNLLEKARLAYKLEDYRKAEVFYNELIDVNKAMLNTEAREFALAFRPFPYMEEGEMFYKQEQYNKASGCFNMAIYTICQNINNYMVSKDIKCIKHFLHDKVGYEGICRLLSNVSEMYRKIGNICEIRGEVKSSLKCFRAAEEIEKGSKIGDRLIARRADHNRYIGDIV